MDVVIGYSRSKKSIDRTKRRKIPVNNSQDQSARIRRFQKAYLKQLERKGKVLNHALDNDVYGYSNKFEWIATASRIIVDSIKPLFLRKVDKKERRAFLLIEQTLVGEWEIRGTMFDGIPLHVLLYVLSFLKPLRYVENSRV